MTEQIKHCDRKELKGKCSLYKTTNLQDCIDCNRALQKPMTEQINSAIRTFNQLLFLGRVDMAKEEIESTIEIAIRSLQAWDEVIDELENMREIIWQDTDNDARIVRANAWDKIEILAKAIDIINQKLSEVEE